MDGHRSEVGRRSTPGLGDDIPCSKCGAVALDTGLECDECGHDMWPEVYPETAVTGAHVPPKDAQ